MITMPSKSIKLAVGIILIFFVLGYNSNIISFTVASSTSDSSEGKDVFGIKEVYPTKPKGREWFLKSEDPRSDGIFYITSDKNITRQSNGSWLINSSEVRMNVDTPPGISDWKNVEITGYARILAVIDPSKENDLAWFARSGI